MEIKSQDYSYIQSKQLDNNSYGLQKIQSKSDVDSGKIEGNKDNSIDSDISTDIIKSKVDTINKSLQNNDIKLAYSKDEKTGRFIVQVKDINTDEVIKQIPTKEMLRIADTIDKFLERYDKKGTFDKQSIDSLINQKA